MSKRSKLADYEIRTGADGKIGIYLRAYNVRMATFNSNSRTLQALLSQLFHRAARPSMAARIKRISGEPVDALTAAMSEPREFSRRERNRTGEGK